MEDNQTVIIRKGKQSVPFLPIIQSPFKDDIDTMLFQRNMKVKPVHEWLESEKGVSTITYMMLYRYWKSKKEDAIEAVVRANAQEAQQANWNLLEDVVSKFQHQVRLGMPVKGGDAIRAVQIMTQMIDRYGGIPGTQQVVADAKRRFMLLLDIVLDVITPEQQAIIYERVQDTPDLFEWTVSEEE
jgi:hypothetical protein